MNPQAYLKTTKRKCFSLPGAGHVETLSGESWT